MEEKNIREVPNKPLISIIVPVYNVEIYLAECIDSLIKQTYPYIEILLLNDGSTDNSGKICEDYMQKDSRVFYYHFENKGLSTTRNRGLEICKGDFVTFVDSDDWLEYSFCEKTLMQILEKKSDCVSCGFKEVNGKKVTEHGPQKNISINQDLFIEKTLSPQTGVSLACGKLWNRRFIQDNRILFDTEVTTLEDVLFHAALAQSPMKVALCGEALYNYRFNPNSIVRSFNEDYYVEIEKSLWRLRKILINDKTIKNKSYFDNFAVYFLLKIAVNYCFHPKNRRSYLEKVQLLKSISNNPLFNSAIKNSNYSQITISRRISLFALKHKMYHVMALIAVIRQIQFKERKK